MRWARAGERVGVARGGRSGAVVQQNVAESVTRWRCVREWREVLCVYGTILSANNNNRRTDVSLIQHCITWVGPCPLSTPPVAQHREPHQTPPRPPSLLLLLHSCPLRLDQSFGQSITIVYLVKRAPLIACTYHLLLPPYGLTRYLHGSRL